METQTPAVGTQAPFGSPGVRSELPKSTLDDLPQPNTYQCQDNRFGNHEWRIIENFHAEFPREAKAPRLYAAYCVYCLTSKAVEVKIN